MSWITLTVDDLNAALTAGEVATITNVAGNGDVRASLITQVTNEVRGYAGSGGPLGPEGTIPDELKDAAVSLIVWRYATSLPVTKLATKPRETAAENARTLLRDVSAGRFRVVPPTTAAPQSQQVARPTIATLQCGNHGNSREDLRLL